MTLVMHTSTTESEAVAIPPVTHAEAGRLARAEYERVLALLEQLAGDDWQQPTYCTEWTVRDMTAHLAGAEAGSTSLKAFVRQNITHPYVRAAANSIDGTNRLQIEERADKTTDELIAEFRQSGAVALANRQKLPWLLRQIPVPALGKGGNIGYLMEIIYTRDQWMHRYDICAATGRQMRVTADHDGRIVDLVLRDIARKLAPAVADRQLTLRLTGALTATYHFGSPAAPACELVMDVFDLNLRASERISAEEARSRAVVTGDAATADWFLQQAMVLY